MYMHKENESHYFKLEKLSIPLHLLQADPHTVKEQVRYMFHHPEINRMKMLSIPWEREETFGYRERRRKK